MAGELTIPLQDAVQSPNRVFSVRTQNRDFNTEAFDSNEAALLEEQFNTLVNDFDSRLLSEMYLQRRSILAQAGAHSKQIFDEKRFGGINAGDNEIAFDVIRPGHIRADPSDGTILNTWEINFDSLDETDVDDGGWIDWVGDGTSANDYTVDEDEVVVVLGLQELEEPSGGEGPSVTGINVDRFGRNVDMLPKDTHTLGTTDNENDAKVQALPAMIGTENDRVHLRLQVPALDGLDSGADADFGTAGVAPDPIYLRPVGVTYGVGAFMNREAF